MVSDSWRSCDRVYATTADTIQRNSTSDLGVRNHHAGPRMGSPGFINTVPAPTTTMPGTTMFGAALSRVLVSGDCGG